MKKNLSALLVVLLFIFGSTSFAAQCDAEIETFRAMFLDHKVDGTLWSKSLNIRNLKMSFYPERNGIDGVDNRASVDISYVLANPSAPVVFIQSGLGGTGQSAYNYYLMGTLSKAGFNVISVPSQYYWRMSLASSPTLRPGYKPTDLAQLTRTYQWIRSQLESNKSIVSGTPNYYVGISNGAYNGIQLANTSGLSFAFKKFVVVNPPLNLNYGIRTLDSIFTEGKKTVSLSRYNTIMAVLVGIFTSPNMTEEQAVQKVKSQLTTAELRYVFSRQLLESVQEAAAVSQVINDQSVFQKTKLLDRLAEAKSWSFQNYVSRILMPFYQAQNISAETLLGSSNLLPDLQAIASRQNLLLLHSKNDFISSVADIEAAQQTLGNRAIVSECGGHVGALSSPGFTNAILNFLR